MGLTKVSKSMILLTLKNGSKTEKQILYFFYKLN